MQEPAAFQTKSSYQLILFNLYKKSEENKFLLPQAKKIKQHTC